MTYIDALPKDLRIELQYYRNDMLGRALNYYLSYGISCPNYAMVNDSEFINDVNNFATNLIPNDLRYTVYIASCHGRVHIISTHMITPSTLLFMCNRLKDIYHLIPLMEHLQNFNDILIACGYGEQLVYHPTSKSNQILFKNEFSHLILNMELNDQLY